MNVSRIFRSPAKLAIDAFSRFWGVAALIALWQLWVLTTTPNSLIVVSPFAVFRGLMADPAVYLQAALWTTAIALSGLGAGMLLGLIAAALTFSSSLLSGLLNPPAMLVASTPVVCIIPLLARVFGYHTLTEFITVVLMMFFPGFVFAGAGLRSLPEGSAALLATWSTPAWKQLAFVAIPAAVPSLGTALRTGSAASILITVVAEYLMQTGGLGALFAATMQQFDIQRAMGASCVAMALSALLYSLASSIEGRIRARFT